MGKNHRKKRFMKRDFKEQRANEWETDKRIPKADGSGYEAPLLSNAAFEEYYQEQGIVPPEEWDLFLECLRKPLPTTFRINGTGKFAAQLRDKLDNDFFAKLRQGSLEVDGEEFEEPHALTWYPDKLAWQFTYSRTQLRKSKALSDVHELLKQENTAGGITRQEAVSMAPPLFLDIQPHHRILDTCAAPGSKTAQMLELLHANGGMPSGFVVANDLEPQRCNLLVHQTRRMNSLAPSLLVANHDASLFPLLHRKGEPKEDAIRFDRVLCDVPCSGDGTLRKAPDLWRRWNVGMGTGLHPLQVRITLHSASLLKLGGRMVYSTCSFNPVEDEAVVAEVLRQSMGALELLDASMLLPDLKRCVGLQRWCVKGKGGYYNNYEDAEQASGTHHNFSLSMFPDEQSDTFPLHRCMRILPHHTDTGGFFIAVLHKVSELPRLQTDRWRRGRDKVQDSWKQRRARQEAAPASSNQKEPAEAGGVADSSGTCVGTSLANGELAMAMEDSAPPLARGPKAAQALGSSSEALPSYTEPDADAAPPASEHTGTPAEQARHFGQDMEQRADDAAQAAVILADAVADEDIGAATDAAEEAAEAAEDMADYAEHNLPAGTCDHEAEASVGSREEAPPEEGSSRPGPSEGPHPITSAAAAEPSAAPGQGKKQRRNRSGEEPIVLFQDKGVLDTLTSFFGFKPDFPLSQQLVMRLGIGNQRGARRLYFISSGIKEVLQKNEDQALKITTAGLKVFERNDKKDPRAGHCPFRIAQDGVPILLSQMTKQVLRPTATEILRILKERSVVLPYSQHLAKPEQEDAASPNVEPVGPAAKRARTESGCGEGDADALTEPAEASETPLKEEPPTQVGERIEPQAEAMKIPLSDLDTLRQLEAIHGGCIVCTLRDSEAKDLGLGPLDSGSAFSGADPIAITCWRGRASIAILVDKNEAAQLAEKLEAAIQAFAGRHAPVVTQ